MCCFIFLGGILLSRIDQYLIAMLHLYFQVALVYPNNDPISFSCAFYGCLVAGVVPVPVEVPSARRVSGYVSRILMGYVDNLVKLRITKYL